MEPSVPVLVLTGPVGVGKTSVGSALSELLSLAGCAHALIDLDWLRWCAPAPPDDPFHTELGLRNLSAVWANHHAAGAERLILVDIVETRAALDGYRAAVPGAEVMVARLHAPLPTILRRLDRRETGASLRWHRQRAAELAEQMARQRVEDLLVNTDERSVGEIAREIAGQLGWV